MDFEKLELVPELLRAVKEEGYSHPTEIQAKTIPHLLLGRDLLGCAQTGTGKTAAFALPILQRLAGRQSDKGHPRALVITPTRELAAQVYHNFVDYGRHTSLKSVSVFGGVRKGDQVSALKNGVDIVVATPGRLMDLMRQKHISLSKVEVLVLDEADRMLDMGFVDDIRLIISKLPAKRQSVLLSATIPANIMYLAREILTNPVEVRITPDRLAADTVGHSVYLVERLDKESLLTHLLANEAITRVLVFTGTKRGADRVSWRLNQASIPADVIHSDCPQVARDKSMKRFKAGQTRVLVASDIAARGIDVDDISHVINYDLPAEPEVYIHRIGRTGRAGAQGEAISFCGIDERGCLDQIEKLIGRPLKMISDHPFPSPLPRTTERAKRPVSNTGRHPVRRRRLRR